MIIVLYPFFIYPLPIRYLSFCDPILYLSFCALLSRFSAHVIDSIIDFSTSILFQFSEITVPTGRGTSASEAEGGEGQAVEEQPEGGRQQGGPQEAGGKENKDDVEGNSSGEGIKIAF